MITYLQLCDIIPHLFIIGMENMCTVFVDIDALDVLGVGIARNVGTPVHDQHKFSISLCIMCKYCSIKTTPTTK